MSRAFRCSVIPILSLLLSCPLLAQQTKSQPPPAPVPAQISAASKIFISNGGGNRLETLGDTAFNGGPDRPYNEFYAAMKTWGRYQLVSSPSDADLVLEISWALNDIGWRTPDPTAGQLRLVVVDPKTHVVLWTIKEYVRGAALLGNRDKNFDSAMNTAVERLKALTTAGQGAGAY